MPARSPEPHPAERRALAAVVCVALGGLLLAATMSSFRAEDWLGLEIGARALTEWRTVLTTMWYDPFYRPATDFYIGLMVRLAPREPWPHLAALILSFGLQTLLLARIARLRGADATGAWVVASAAWTQVNVYAWSTLWMSNAGGSLATGFLLAAIWLHHRDVAGGRNSGFTRVGLGAVTVFALLSKEDAVVLPGILVALEALRWRQLTPAERRRSLESGLIVAGLVAIYVAFRLTIMPTPQVPGQYYQLRFGINWLQNLSRFLLHLGLLPLGALVLTRWCYPSAWIRDARRDPSWPRARNEILAGLAWAAVAAQIFLPIGGFAYGYLLGPGMGIAYAAGWWIAWAWSVRGAPADRRASPARVVALQWVVMVLAVGWAFTQAGWPRYRAVARDAFATLERVMPVPPESALVVFIDPPARETITGRSLFNMVFDGVPGSALRVHYGRADLRGRYVSGPGVRQALEGDTEADLVVIAERGRLRVLRVGPRLSPRPEERGP